MSNFGAAALITAGILLAVAGYVLGDLNVGDLALLSFALLIACNCQDWTKG